MIDPEIKAELEAVENRLLERLERLENALLIDFRRRFMALEIRFTALELRITDPEKE